MGQRSKWMAALVFAASGLSWIAFAILGEGNPVLVTAGVINLLSVFGMLGLGKGKFVWSLIVSASLFNLIVYGYQTYAASVLLSVHLNQTTALALAGYLFAVLIFGFLLLRIYARPNDIIRLQSQKSSAEGRKNRD